MKIARVNGYSNDLFDREILLQHGAFMLEDYIPCSFRITGRSSAVVSCPEDLDLTEAMEAFRFYTPHIVEFYNEKGNLIRKFPAATIIQLDLMEIQPSQFYVSQEKIVAVSTFIHSGADIIVQLGILNGIYVSLDGHTRLAYAVLKGMKQVYGCLADDLDGYTEGFVAEAQRRGIFSPYDMEVVSHKEYEVKWNQFCEDYFARLRAEKEVYAYHVVTERPMSPGQHIIFNETKHNGVFQRVYEKWDKVQEIYANPEKYSADNLEHHTAVAMRELALEEVRQNKYPSYPSRMGCLYVSNTLEEAEKWSSLFIQWGRPTYQIVKLKINGNRFTGNANYCFDARLNKDENLLLADRYWQNPPSADEEIPIVEILAGGDIEVVEIMKAINANIS